jgi:hypothetical protein
MIDAKRYLRLKPKGLTKIVERDNSTFLQFARFDIEDGSPSDPEEQKVNVEEIKARKQECQTELAGIEMFLDDLDE